MAKKPATTPTSGPAAVRPKVYEATTRASDGAVVRGRELAQADAEALRKAGGNVVECGPDHVANMDLAEEIERNASGRWKRCPFHRNAGPKALPHYQPDPRPVDDQGHTFYETSSRKAV